MEEVRADKYHPTCGHGKSTSAVLSADLQGKSAFVIGKEIAKHRMDCMICNLKKYSGFRPICETAGDLRTLQLQTLHKGSTLYDSTEKSTIAQDLGVVASKPSTIICSATPSQMTRQRIQPEYIGPVGCLQPQNAFQ